MTTAHLNTLARRVQQWLLAQPWPPPTPVPPEWQVRIDAWRALWAWHVAGDHCVDVSERVGASAPLIDTAARIADQRLRREAACFDLGAGEWIVIARLAAGTAVPISADRSRIVGAKSPYLVWVTELRGGIESGYANLDDQPTIRDLRIVGGFANEAAGLRQRAGHELADAGLMLARALPAFLDTTPQRQ